MSFFSLALSYRYKICFILLAILFTNLSGLVFPWGLKLIIDDVLVHQNRQLFYDIIYVFAGVVILKTGFGFLRYYLSHIVGEKIVQDLRQKVFEHIPRLSLSNIACLTPSQILSRMTVDAEVIRRFLFTDAIEFVYACLSVGLIVSILGFINLKLTLVSLMALPIFIVGYTKAFPWLKTFNRQYRDLYGRLFSRIGEVLNGIKTVRAFSAFGYETIKFKSQQKNLFNVSRQMQFYNAWMSSAVEFFTVLGLVGVVWIGGQDVLNQKMTVGELVAFYSYLGMLFSPIIRMVVVQTSYQEASSALKRIEEVLIVNDNRCSDSIDKKAILTSIQYVQFEDVNFSYSSSQKILHNINISVLQGEMIGVVGPSGCGKTTLLNLLLRFFDPSQGEIKINGYNLKQMDPDVYRRHTAVVLQDDFLFEGTVADNIRYGNWDADIKALVGAAKRACAHDFIMDLPDAYDAQIGERGCFLSCGQRQRIAIARALLRNPSVLVLDEATSALDSITENKIQQSIRQLMSKKIVFMAAHRFSSIMQADKIIVLDQGRIIAMDTHNNLLKTNSFYSNLYLEQVRSLDEGQIQSNLGRDSSCDYSIKF